MASDREKFPIGTLDVNDGVNFDMESFVFTPAQKKPQLVSSGDSDGEALARESHYTSAYAEMEIRVCHQANTAAAIAKLGEITDAVQACEREEGGLPCPWIPNGTEAAYTAYAISGDITELPIEVSGEGAGWFIDCPKVKVKLTLRPFLEAEERVVLAPTESAAAPLHEVLVGDIGGDVPALGRLVLTDKSSQNRRFAQYGQDVVFDETPPGCLIVADDLVTEGFSGEAKTRSGAYGSEKVKRATAVSLATTICETKALEHVGSFGVYLRVYAATSDARFRISYRDDDGALWPLRWVTPPVAAAFSDIYMGEVSLDEVEVAGRPQASRIRIEHKSAGASHANDINFLTLIPTRASCSARGLANNSPTKLFALDEFLQSEGALAGKTLQVGGTWGGAGDADDFTVIAAQDLIRRTATSDTNVNSGRYALAGSTEYTTFEVAATIVAGTNIQLNTCRIGVIGRYVDPENWLAGLLVFESGDGGNWLVKVLERIGGTVTELGRIVPDGSSASGSPLALLQSYALSLRADSTGAWRLSADWGVKRGEVSGVRESLRTGGSLEKGKAGVYDAWASATAANRYLDSFQVVGADAPGLVCVSSKSLEFSATDVLREGPAGDWGQPDLPRGANFFLEPAGDSGAINRVVSRMRRSDIRVEADAAVTDKQLLEVRAVERFLTPR